MKKHLYLLMTIVFVAATGLVWAVAAIDGASLYDANCATCHGPLATSGKNGATASRIQEAIAANVGDMGTISLASDEIESIATVLASPIIYDGSNFTVNQRQWQPAPSGHVAGKDNGPGEAIHHPGEDCGICHVAGGRAANKLWTMSGTVYDTRGARRPLAGAEIIFQNINGAVFSMTANELGNFWTDKPFFDDPAKANTGTWEYKGWVKYGNSVRPMVSIAPVGSGSSRMSCSMHHAGMGSRGGLWVVSSDTLKSYPATGLSYRKHIFPILRSKCSPCHIPGDTFARGPSDPKYDYSKGLDLMTYEGSSVFVPSYIPHGSTEPLPDITWTKAGILSVVDPSSPASSLLLVKTLEGATHGGGAFWTAADADYKALLQWISEGALKN